MSQVVSIFLILCAFCRVAHFTDIYVLPAYPDPPPCPCPPPPDNGTTAVLCETLSFYGNYTDVLKPNDNVTAYVLCGAHTSTDPLIPISLRNMYSLTIKPAVEQDNYGVLFVNFTFKIENVKFLRIENLNISNVELLVYPLSEIDSQGAVHVVNCTFTDLPNSLLVAVNLTVEDSSFQGCSSTALNLFHSTMNLRGKVSFINNTGVSGGALYLSASRLNIENGSDVEFIDNTATATGGAIHVDDASLYVYEAYKHYHCFYTLVNYDNQSDASDYRVIFRNNLAQLGGHHIYGASMRSYCTASSSGLKPTYSFEVMSHNIFQFYEPSLETHYHSSISGRPMRVCMCDENDQPQCTNTSKIVPLKASEHIPGEKIQFRVSLVGGDFGLATGTMYISYSGQNADCSSMIASTNCTTVNYTIYQQLKSNKSEVLCLSTAQSAQTFCREEGLLDYHNYIQRFISEYERLNVIDPYLLDTPILVNVSFRQCPPGFYLEGPPYHCVCHKVFKTTKHSNDSCLLENGTGYVASTSMWFNATHDKIMTSERCPTTYCKDSTGGYIDLQNASDAHCVFNHSGVLCGGCIDNNSVALGSTHCIYCQNNNNLALIVFFAAAGLLLVFFVSILNLTVTQGMINTIIFYANIVWAQQNLFFPASSHRVLPFFKTFIAWINLDFGIQMCFFKGMDAYVKTWLQFVFPMYISLIAGLMIIGARLSNKLTKLIGNRAVPLIDTLLLLSYVKLLRTIVESLSFADITTFVGTSTQGHRTWVWLYDGRLDYFTSRHGVLFFIAVVALLFLWMPYTLLLLLVQLWRRLSGHCRLFRWVSKLYPVLDTHLAPLKSKHQYWFGVLLLARGIVYLAGLNPFRHVTLFITAIVITLLLFYMVLVRPYKSRMVFFLECLSFLNLGVLSITIFFTGLDNARPIEIIVSVSCGIAFLQFGGIVLMSFCDVFGCKLDTIVNKFGRRHRHGEIEVSNMVPPGNYDQYRDSIFNETEPLLRE